MTKTSFLILRIWFCYNLLHCLLCEFIFTPIDVKAFFKL